ncbi:MAG: cytochrome c [Nitrospirae bacterium]|nr:cytochrome c [Nitrospirota bacterium]MBI4837947.1 cytochrome c [Nitrospirota bacterium]
MKIIKIILLGSLFVLIILIAIRTVQGEPKTSLKAGEELYVWYCIPCHGLAGDGKGFNAKNLDPRPANHTDGGFMKKRTDKELLDAVSGGGKAVGKSTLMPPWGNTFTETQMKSLVLYLRKLCRCVGE